MLEAVKVLAFGIDENVDIGIIPGLVSGVRAEQIERRNAVRPKLGFDGFQRGNDLSPSIL